MNAATPEQSRARPRSQRASLGLRARRAVLVLHILAIGAWIGIDVLVAVLVGTGWWADDLQTRAAAYRALADFVLWPMLVAALASLTTGVMLGVGTPWGLMRYRWVAVKLVITVILTVLIIVALRPTLAELAPHVAALEAGRDIAAEVVASLPYPPTVSLLALTAATILAVVKPWGRKRRRRRVEAPDATAATTDEHSSPERRWSS